MSDRTQSSDWPSPKGPWPEAAEDGSRVYDHGWPWCAVAAGHPDPEGGYPDPEVHVPWSECRTLAAAFDGVRLGLDGAAAGLDVYGAARFRFGELRTATARDVPRIVLECYFDAPEAAESSNEEVVRFSLPVGEALRLGRRLAQIVDFVTIPSPQPRD